MSNYVIKKPSQVALPISGIKKLFPVRRVYCIGRNYAQHAIEMGHDPIKEPPFFFQKNSDNLDSSGEFPYPQKTNNVHYEVEMAVMLKSGGIDIELNNALSHVYGYAICLDMTRRDLQSAQKKLGRPWEIGKAFERSAPIGVIHQAKEIGHLMEGFIQLKVNREIKQQGNLNQMIWKVPEMVSYLSEYFELDAGDVIFSGTPAGVGSIKTGDIIEASIENLGNLKVSVKEPKQNLSKSKHC